MPSSLYETCLQRIVVVVFIVAKSRTCFVTMIPCRRVSQRELIISVLSNPYCKLQFFSFQVKYVGQKQQREMITEPESEFGVDPNGRLVKSG